MLIGTKVKILLAILAFAGGVISAGATIVAGALANLDKVRALLDKPPVVGEFTNRTLSAYSNNGQGDKRADCVSAQGRKFDPKKAKVIRQKEYGPHCEMDITSATESEVCFKVWAMPEAKEIPVTCMGYPQVHYAAQ